MIALHTASLEKYGLNRIFEFAKKAGYDGIEVGVEKNDFDTQNAAYLKELSERHEIPILALHAPKNGTENSTEHVVQMAEFLKCPVVVVTPPKFLDFKFTAWLKKAAPELRKQKKIQIALINAPGKTMLGFLPARSLNNLSDLKKFGMIAIDSSATHSKKWDLIRIYEYLKKLVVHVQLSNVRRGKEYSRPEEGVLPIESFLRKLKENQYKGAVSILVRPAELEAGDDEKVIKNLKKIKLFLEEYLN